MTRDLQVNKTTGRMYIMWYYLDDKKDPWRLNI
jgi:hypothetical protein